MADGSAVQITQLFTNDVLHRLERLRLNASRRFTNRSRGEHLSGRRGQSTEFSDYRNYTEGEDIRFVDWNIFARLHRPYLKVFREEEEMHVVILLDNSKSMAFEDKLQRARQLAGAFAVMGLLGNERVSVYLTNPSAELPARLPPCRGRAAMRKALPFIESVGEGGAAELDAAIETLLTFHSGRGVIVILSDFLTTRPLDRALNLTFSSGLELYCLQLLGPTELAPDVSGDLRFVDCETDQVLDVSSALELLSLYDEHRQSYQDRLADLCRKRDGRYLCVNSESPARELLFDVLLRRGWLRTV